MQFQIKDSHHTKKCQEDVGCWFLGYCADVSGHIVLVFTMFNYGNFTLIVLCLHGLQVIFKFSTRRPLAQNWKKNLLIDNPKLLKFLLNILLRLFSECRILIIVHCAVMCGGGALLFVLIEPIKNGAPLRLAREKSV